MGTLSSYSRPGMVATNISNYMRGNPMTSLGLTALGTMIGVPALGVMNAVNSVYGGGSSGSSTGSGQGGDGSGDGGDEEDERTPISSFDSALLTPDLLDSYNLAKNRDYRLFQSSNNPFYSLQRNPSGGINNVYTEFKKGGRVGFAEGGSMSKGLDYLSGVERRGYQEGSSTLSREEIINRILQEIKPGFESAREVYPDYYSTGLDVDYLKTLDPDEIKQALDRAYLQGEGFQNADFTSGRIGQGSPFFRYSPEYMKKVNYNNPLQISNSNTAYNLRNQLNELESILGKKNIEAYKTTLDDSLIDYYKNRFTADLDLQKKLFGEQTTPTVEEQMVSPDDAMNQYDISNQMNEGQITSFDSIGNRLENIVNNPAIKGFTNFVTGSGNPFQDISQFTPSQQSVINQAIENAAKEGRTNITYADYPKTGVVNLRMMDFLQWNM
jgi:hypothetical protein